jgi:hypothetical protein
MIVKDMVGKVVVENNGKFYDAELHVPSSELIEDESGKYTLILNANNDKNVYYEVIIMANVLS